MSYFNSYFHCIFWSYDVNHVIMSFAHKRVYNTFFLGRNFVYGVHCTPNQNKLLKTLKIKNLKPKKFSLKSLGFFSSPVCVGVTCDCPRRQSGA